MCLQLQIPLEVHCCFVCVSPTLQGPPYLLWQVTRCHVPQVGLLHHCHARVLSYAAHDLPMTYVYTIHLQPQQQQEQIVVQLLC
jgi:hypothetical protein